MAIINAKFDTITKELTVTKDDEEMDNVHNVAMGKFGGGGDGEDYGCMITQHNINTDHQTQESNYLRASEETNKAMRDAISEFLSKIRGHN